MSERTIIMLLIVAGNLVVNDAMSDTPNISCKSKSETACDTAVSSFKASTKTWKLYHKRHLMSSPFSDVLL